MLVFQRVNGGGLSLVFLRWHARMVLPLGRVLWFLGRIGCGD